MRTGLKETIEWYNRNARFYAGRNNLIYPNDSVQLENFLKLLNSGAKILDAGCGSGRFCKLMKDKGFLTTGIDLSSELIRLAKESYPELEFIEGDLRSLPFENQSFDGVWAHASLVHAESRKDVLTILKEFYRVLNANGVVRVMVKKNVIDTEAVIEPFTKEERFFRYFQEDDLCRFLERANFTVLKVMAFNEFEKNGMGRKDTNWIELIAKK